MRSSALSARVRRTVRITICFGPGDASLVGVSGGADSTCPGARPAGGRGRLRGPRRRPGASQPPAAADADARRGVLRGAGGAAGAAARGRARGCCRRSPPEPDVDRRCGPNRPICFSRRRSDSGLGRRGSRWRHTRERPGRDHAAAAASRRRAGRAWPASTRGPGAVVRPLLDVTRADVEAYCRRRAGMVGGCDQSGRGDSAQPGPARADAAGCGSIRGGRRAVIARQAGRLP